MKRRVFVQAMLGLAAGMPVFEALAQAAPYPSRPIRIIAGSAPGALLDIASRLYAERLSTYLKVPVVVDNMAGASSQLAVRTVVRGAPDGYTILAGANTIVTIPYMVKDAGYDVRKDLIGIGEMARSPGLLVVGRDSPYKTLGDLVAAAKAKPGTIAYASGGLGTTSHLPMEMFVRQAGINLIHVPYKGVAVAVPDVVAGRAAGLMGTATSFIGLMKTGALRAIGITSETRSAKFPEVPTFKESGFGDATFSIFVGLMGPVGLPPAIRAKLGEAMEAARNDKGLRERLDGIDQEISDVRTPEAFNAYMMSEEAKYAKVIKDANIKPE